VYSSSIVNIFGENVRTPELDEPVSRDDFDRGMASKRIYKPLLILSCPSLSGSESLTSFPFPFSSLLHWPTFRTHRGLSLHRSSFITEILLSVTGVSELCGPITSNISASSAPSHRRKASVHPKTRSTCFYTARSPTTNDTASYQP